MCIRDRRNTFWIAVTPCTGGIKRFYLLPRSYGRCSCLRLTSIYTSQTGLLKEVVKLVAHRKSLCCYQCVYNANIVQIQALLNWHFYTIIGTVDGDSKESAAWTQIPELLHFTAREIQTVTRHEPRKSCLWGNWRSILGRLAMKRQSCRRWTMSDLQVLSNALSKSKNTATVSLPSKKLLWTRFSRYPVD